MKCLIIILSLTLSTSVFAWGSTGHRVVGEVATKYLDINVAFKINKLLNGMSLAQVSTWADEIRSEPETYMHTFNWHYTTWPAETEEHSENHETESTGFLLKSINQQLSILRSPDSPDNKKSEAIKFLVHLVGDLHMPLHVGNSIDQGGNFCKVTYMGRPYNLHSLWDEGLIDYTNLSFTEMAKFVIQARNGDDFIFAQKGTPLDWALESKKIVPTLYPADVVSSPLPMSTRTYCLKEVQPEQIPKLSFEYAYKHKPVLEKRLYQSGVRLAVLLNQNLK